ncbi:hypothetical protein WA158_002472 [Blastocystis sp. Blastoise]
MNPDSVDTKDKQQIPLINGLSINYNRTNIDSLQKKSEKTIVSLSDNLNEKKPKSVYVPPSQLELLKSQFTARKPMQYELDLMKRGKTIETSDRLIIPTENKVKKISKMSLLPTPDQLAPSMKSSVQNTKRISNENVDKSNPVPRVGSLTKKKSLSKTVSSLPINDVQTFLSLKQLPMKSTNIIVSLFGWENCYKANERQKSILLGLDYIYKLSLDSNNFHAFGTDIYQCFYDISKASVDPIRSRCLLYLQKCGKIWKLSIEKEGWKGNSIPNAQELLDASMLAYSLDCLSIYSNLKQTIQPFFYTEDSNHKNKIKSGQYSCADLFGWDPRTECIPKDMTEMCLKCKTFSSRGSNKCNQCNKNLYTLSPYRALSNALIYMYYINSLGLETDISYVEYLAWLPMLKPYCSPNEIEGYMFNDQSYLITHVIFTLSSWGQLTLSPSLLPHEYIYIKTYLPFYIQLKDIHLIGEFIECLRIFGIQDDNSIIKEGYDTLLKLQKEDGSWDNDGSKDNYTVYHAVMVSCQALLNTHYNGQGPANVLLKDILQEWVNIEFKDRETVPVPVELNDRCEPKQ